MSGASSRSRAATRTKFARVLRLHEGDRIEVVDSAANAFAASIDDVGRVVRARLVEIAGERRDRPQRAARRRRAGRTEGAAHGVRRREGHGARRERLSSVLLRAQRRERRSAREKLARWRRLARTAAQQCGRRDVPEVAQPLRFDALLARFSRLRRRALCVGAGPAAPLHECLRAALPRSGRVLVVVGPEGGFTHDEAEAARQNGAALLSLGPRISRTDTAAIALLAVIGALTS